jgi:hypothetical protein
MNATDKTETLAEAIAASEWPLWWRASLPRL